MLNKEWFKLNAHSIAFYLAALFLALSWFILNWPKTIKILSSILFLIAEAAYNIRTQDNKTTRFTKFINWLGFSIMLAFTVIYIAVSVNEVKLAIVLLLALFFVIVVSAIIFNIIGLFKTERLSLIVITYIIISFLIITLFGYTYTLPTADKNTSLVWASTKTELNSSWDFMYFSSSVYYSDAASDIQPYGFGKAQTQIESAISFIFHVIILGFVISNIFKQNRVQPTNGKVLK